MTAHGFAAAARPPRAPATVAVVGGGLAGITAALRCADAGCAVTLYESRARLGGLTHSFRRDEPGNDAGDGPREHPREHPSDDPSDDPGDDRSDDSSDTGHGPGGLWVDNGQHVFLRCCTAYRSLLERLGVADLVTLQPRLDIALRGPRSGAVHSHRLRGAPLPAPLHLAPSLARYPWLSLSERLALTPAARALARLDPAAPGTDERSFGDWLHAHGQSRRAVRTLWDLVGVATLNARAEDASLALAATVFQTGLLGSRDGGDIGWSRVPLQRLHGAAGAEGLRAAGVDLRLKSRVTTLTREPRGWTVHAGDEARTADAVVVAVPPAAAEALVPQDAVEQPPGWGARLGSAPIVNLHLVWDRPVSREPFFAGVDSPVQWVFDRTGPSGLEHGQYLAVSLSAAEDLVDLPTAELRARYLPALAELLPECRHARLVRFFVTRERAATFRPAPGSRAHRPAARTRAEGLCLAGAWTDTGWPATMEGAVRSGEAAAAAALDALAHEGLEHGEPCETGGAAAARPRPRTTRARATRPGRMSA